MSERNVLIQKRALEIFSRENKNPALTLDLNFVSIEHGRKTTAAIPIEARDEIYKRAEQELINEGIIAHA